MRARHHIFCALIAAAILTGCATQSEVARNPLEGWKVCQDQCPYRVNDTVKADYQAYIATLSAQEREFVYEYNIWYFERDSDLHAVMIKIPLNGVWWDHVLVYNHDNIRVRVVKFSGGEDKG
jgi:hypothetical protein